MLVDSYLAIGKTRIEIGGDIAAEQIATMAAAMVADGAQGEDGTDCRTIGHAKVLLWQAIRDAETIYLTSSENLLANTTAACRELKIPYVLQRDDMLKGNSITLYHPMLSTARTYRVRSGDPDLSLLNDLEAAEAIAVTAEGLSPLRIANGDTRNIDRQQEKHKRTDCPSQFVRTVGKADPSSSLHRYAP